MNQKKQTKAAAPAADRGLKARGRASKPVTRATTSNDVHSQSAAEGDLVLARTDQPQKSQESCDTGATRASNKKAREIPSRNTEPRKAALNRQYFNVPEKINHQWTQAELEFLTKLH